MMIKVLQFTFVCLLLCLLGLPTVQASGVHEAHKFYIQGEFKKSVAAIKAVLMNPKSTDHEKKNVILLINKMHEEIPDHVIPVDWKLPPQLLTLDICQTVYQNAHYERKYYFTCLSAAVQKKDIVKQIQLRSASGEVFLDKEQKVGKFTQPTAHGLKDPRVQMVNDDKSLKPDLYFLDIEFTDGSKPFQAWFIVSRHVFSDPPKQTYPKLHDNIKESSPTVKWGKIEKSKNEFSSLQLVDVVFRKQNEECNYERVWFASFPNTKTQLKVGNHNLYKRAFLVQKGETSVKEYNDQIWSGRMTIRGDSKLEDGKYYMQLFYHEIRRFGPIELSKSKGLINHIFINVDESADDKCH